MQITFDLLQTTAIGSAVVFLGIWLRRRVLLLERYCLPGPVVAGLLASLLFLLLRTAFGVQITWNLQMKDLFMNLFFTCVGFGASARLLRPDSPARSVDWWGCSISSALPSLSRWGCTRSTA